jgi:23S rRNA pseudouridine1911/1915/1917 synthase
VHPEGAAAQTRFVVERRFAATQYDGAPVCLLRAFPETGRMHQIRVHAAQLGHPLVGDKIYGADENCYLRFIETGWTPELAAALWLPRHALHAAIMSIESEQLRWAAPLAPDLATFLSASGIALAAPG